MQLRHSCGLSVLVRSSTYLVFSANYGYQQCVVRMSYNSRLMAVALIVLRVTCGKVLSLSAMSKYAQCTFQYGHPLAADTIGNSNCLLSVLVAGKCSFVWDGFALGWSAPGRHSRHAYR